MGAFIIAVFILALISVICDINSKAKAKRIEYKNMEMAAIKAQYHLDIINKCNVTISQSKSLVTITEQFGIINSNINCLILLSNRFNLPNLTSLSPQEMREDYLIKKELVIQNLILELVENDIAESAYNRALLRLEYGKKALNSETYRADLNEKENQIRSLIDQFIPGR